MISNLARSLPATLAPSWLQETPQKNPTPARANNTGANRIPVMPPVPSVPIGPE